MMFSMHQSFAQDTPQVRLMLTFVGRVRLVSSFATLRDDQCTGCVPKKYKKNYPWNKDKKNRVQ